jgi:chromosome partitioning protein|tara:strand:- start:5684 stop:6313 length:630 start_codon:yes stop_codon:yes gene_type:complete
MTKVLAFLNHKGGVSKTTLTLNAAKILTDMGDKVLVIDTDVQRSALKYAANNEDMPFSVIGIDSHKSVVQSVKQFSGDYDWILIDGAAKAQEMTAALLKIVDLIVIPVKTSQIELDGVEDIVSMIKIRQEIADGSPVAAFQVSMIQPNTQIGRDIFEALEGYELPILEGGIYQRIAHANVSSYGGFAVDMDKTVKAEITKMIEQIQGAF